MSLLSVCSFSMPDLPESYSLIIVVRHIFHKHRKSFSSEENDSTTFPFPPPCSLTGSASWASPGSEVAGLTVT